MFVRIACNHISSWVSPWPKSNWVGNAWAPLGCYFKAMGSDLAVLWEFVLASIFDLWAADWVTWHKPLASSLLSELCCMSPHISQWLIMRNGGEGSLAGCSFQKPSTMKKWKCLFPAQSLLLFAFFQWLCWVPKGKKDGFNPQTLLMPVSSPPTIKASKRLLRISGEETNLFSNQFLFNFSWEFSIVLFD